MAAIHNNEAGDEDMKASEIQIGGEYQAKLSGDQVPVRIVSENHSARPACTSC